MTLFKLGFGHVNDGFLTHSSAAATVPNIPRHLFGVGALGSFVKLDDLLQPSEGPIGTGF